MPESAAQKRKLDKQRLQNATEDERTTRIRANSDSQRQRME